MMMTTAHIQATREGQWSRLLAEPLGMMTHRTLMRHSQGHRALQTHISSSSGLVWRHPQHQRAPFLILQRSTERRLALTNSRSGV